MPNVHLDADQDVTTPCTEERRDIYVALAFDECYAIHGATAMHSMMSNAACSDRLHFYVIDTGLATDTRAKLELLCQGRADVAFLTVPVEFFHGLPTTYHAVSTYARLALPSLLPDHEKLLYVDSDIVVVKSLSELWATDISHYVVAAARDSMELFRGEAIPYWRSIGLPHTATYFSAGVLLLNLNRWRADCIVDQLRTWIAVNAERMMHSDQSALNAVLCEQVKLLHLRWNLQTPLIPPVRYGWGCTRELFEAVQDPGIIHYVTGRKPWRLQYRVPMAQLYWRYRSALEWDCPDVGYSPSIVAGRLKEEIVHIARCLRTEARRMCGRIPAPR